MAKPFDVILDEDHGSLSFGRKKDLVEVIFLTDFRIIENDSVHWADWGKWMSQSDQASPEAEGPVSDTPVTVCSKPVGLLA